VGVFHEPGTAVPPNVSRWFLNLNHVHQVEMPVMKRKAVVALCGNEDPAVGLYLGS